MRQVASNSLIAHQSKYGGIVLDAIVDVNLSHPKNLDFWMRFKGQHMRTIGCEFPSNVAFIFTIECEFGLLDATKVASKGAFCPSGGSEDRIYYLFDISEHPWSLDESSRTLVILIIIKFSII